MMEIGRVCVKTAGRDAGGYCIILEVLDNKFVLIDGQTRRRKCNLSHLEPTDKSVDIGKDASHEKVVKVLKSLDIEVVEKKIESKTKQKTEKPRKRRAYQKTKKPVKAVKGKKSEKKSKPEKKKSAKPIKAKKEETTKPENLDGLEQHIVDETIKEKKVKKTAKSK